MIKFLSKNIEVSWVLLIKGEELLTSKTHTHVIQETLI